MFTFVLTQVAFRIKISERLIIYFLVEVNTMLLLKRIPINKLYCIDYYKNVFHIIFITLTRFIYSYT